MFRISRIFTHFTLMQKMLLLTLFAGLMGWAVLDKFQSKRLTDIFSEQLDVRFAQQAKEDRLRFEEYVRNFYQTIKFITNQPVLQKYIEQEKWKSGSRSPVIYNSRPEWLPSHSVMRLFSQPRSILMFDDFMNLREVYQVQNDHIHTAVSEPSIKLLEMASGQSSLVMLGHKPHVVTAETIYGESRDVKATIMLVSPVDEDFLSSSQVVSANNNIVALVDENTRKIIASNNSSIIIDGSPLESLQESFIYLSEPFFGKDMSHERLAFVSIKAKDEVVGLTESVLKLARQENIVTTAVFIGSFSIIMIFITRRIERLGQRIAVFSKEVLHGKQHDIEKGDQLFMLDQRFKFLLDEVVETRESLKREAAERILLIRKNVEEKENQLGLLQSTTGVLGVGVIVMSKTGKCTPANEQMESFVAECGDIEMFVPHQNVESEERHCRDEKGNGRVFNIRNMGKLSDDRKMFLVQEITELKNKTQELEHKALHDDLTGLPNRTLLYERIDQAIRLAQREYKMVVVFMMDLDRFKEINDTLGHHLGDLLLQEVAKRLRFTLRDSDTIARFGGDEFAVLLTVPDEERAVRVARKVMEAMDKEFVVDGHSISTSISIGISVFPTHGEDPNVLMQRADVAMYVAKQAHTGFAFYDPRQDPHSVNRLALMGELRHAIDKDELIPYFQPKVDMKTGKVVSSEALVRWHHSRDGFIPPDMFVPIAEQTGLVKQLTYWVVDKAIHQCARWHREGVDVSVSINLSARNLQDTHLADFISELLVMCAVKPEWVIFEITESAIMTSPADARSTLDKLDKMGVGLSIDDFGTGHSSLSYIKQLPVSEIKIDKTFVMEMTDNENDAIIVRATVDMAHNLGLRVIAEGVETKDAYDTLEILGCDQVQGYLISPPMPADKFTSWYKSSPWGEGDQKSSSSKIRRIK